MREKLIHEYFGVKYEVIWDTVKTEIPDLRNRFEELFEEIGKEKL